MKIKRISKSSVKYFFTSALLTAVFIIFVAGFIVTEKNTAAIGFEKISTPLSLSASEGRATLVVNDRELEISLKPLLYVFQSKTAYAALALFLLL